MLGKHCYAVRTAEEEGKEEYEEEEKKEENLERPAGKLQGTCADGQSGLKLSSLSVCI